ncbi:MAG: hypothetical protein HFK09_00565 [Clostridia bacterium]|nr:hypothetical protein [Clostridia bacterium]
MFRQIRNYNENKDKREKSNYEALTPAQKRIYNFINSSSLELNGESVPLRCNGLSIDCFVSVDKLKVGITTNLIEREIKKRLADEGLPCPPIYVRYV